MENDCIRPKWLEWAKEIQFIAQAGIEYSPDPFDRERFERLRELAAEYLRIFLILSGGVFVTVCAAVLLI